MMALGLAGKPSITDDIAVASTRREPNGGQLDNCVLNGEHHPPVNKLPEGGSESTVQRHDRKQRHRMRKTQSEGVAFMRSSLANEEPRLSLESVIEEEPTKIATLSDFPQTIKVLLSSFLYVSTALLSFSHSHKLKPAGSICRET